MVKGKTIKVFLVLGALLFSIAGGGCATGQNSAVSNSDEGNINEPQTYYMDVIDPFSSITFDYENPNYGYASLNVLLSGYRYYFDGEQIYSLISEFNDVPISIPESDAHEEELYKQAVNGINIKVSYKFETRDTENDDAVVNFYVLENGTLLFEDNRELTLYYSDANVVNYNEFKNKIMSTEDNMVDEICEAYLNKILKPKREDAVIEDVWLFQYMGTYNGCFVGTLLDRKNCVFVEVVCELVVEDLVFRYSYGYDIYVYDGTDFLDLLTAYNQSKLTYDNLVQIYYALYPSLLAPKTANSV
ncbi:MAG: hypothetical protein IJ308_02465 [Clostridia bacterium]|nr:hypothetical protein [Clostridia bacterium]